MSNPVIQIDNLTKHYPIFRKPSEGLKYLIKGLVRGLFKPSAGQIVVRALENINLAISKGERVGIIGRNGAGKSTLLKMMAGGFPPTSGSLVVNGHIYSLLPGSISFSPDLSAYDNARNYLAYYDLAPNELAQRLADIEDFTELGDYFYQPIKNYSLGMRVRAEFAVATSVHADIIVIDEVLGAGDIYWSEKIAARMEALCAQGITLLLVSHSLDQIMRFCKRVIWIERGCVVMDGSVNIVTPRYEGFLERLKWQTDDLDDKSLDLESIVPELGDTILPDSGQQVVRWPGRGDVLLTGVRVNGSNDTSLTISPDDPLSFQLIVTATRTGQYVLRYLMTFWGVNGKRVAVLENEGDKIELTEGAKHDVVVDLPKVGLVRGRYLMTITIADVSSESTVTHEQLIRLDVLYKSFQIELTDSSSGADNALYPAYRLPLKVFYD